MKLYQLAVKRKVTFIMIFIGIVGIGLVSFFQLQPELLPDLTYPAATIQITYEGVGPLEMENLITRHVEQGVAAIDRVEEISSSVREGRSVTTVEFEWGTNMDSAVADIRSTMDILGRSLPDEATSPMVFKFDFSMLPIMFIGLSGPMDRAQMRELSENVVEPRLENVEGIASVTTGGGREREIRVDLDRAGIESLNIPITRIISAIGSENISRPAGDIKTDKREYLIRTDSEFKDMADMNDIIIDVKNGAPLFLTDVAQLRNTYKEPVNQMKMNGEPAVMLVIQRQSGANTVQAARNVKEAIPRIKTELPRGVEFNILTDTSEFIEKSIEDLGAVAVQGGLLAIIILLFFLRNLRATFIIALAIPISIISCFTAMRAGGVTLNVMSLGGLALVVGMLVDNSVVVLENIFRHREEGETMAESAVWGTNEVAMPIIASTLTTIVVFLPIFFIPGIAGVLFKEQAITVTLSLAVSLFVALSLIPLLSSILLKLKDKKTPSRKISRFSENFIRCMENYYGKVIRWALGHRKLVIFTVLILFIASILAVFPLRWVPTEFMPRVDQGSVDINIEMPVGTNLDTTIKKTEQIEDIVFNSIPEIQSSRTRVGPGGGPGGGGGRTGSHVAQISLELVDLSQRDRTQGEITSDLRSKLKDITGTEIRFGSGRLMGGLMGGGDSIEVEIYGYDLDTAKNLSRKVEQILENISTISDINISLEETRPEYNIDIDRKKAGMLGLNPAAIAGQIEAYVRGQTAGYLRIRGNEYPITVRLKEEDRKDIQQLENLPVARAGGTPVKLKSFSHIRPAMGPVSIERKNQSRLVTVSADFTGRDLGGISALIDTQLEEINLPPGFIVRMAGEAQEQRESFFWLGLAFLGAVILVYMVMASQFESLLDPFIVMFSIPLALIGVIVLFFFTGTSLSVISLIGIIMLTGIVVNNSIVLVDYINLLRARGLNLNQAVITGGQKRLRPVLMTAFTTMLALVPMAIGLGEGAELRYPLARAVVGGLLAATVLILIVIPVIYTIFESHLGKKGGSF